jgi:hypothetical protein
MVSATLRRPRAWVEEPNLMIKRGRLLSTFSLAVGLTLATGGMAVAQGDPVAGANSAAAGSTFLAAELSGANETAGGDPDGSGHAVVRIQDTQVCFLLSWSKLAQVVASHIHMGAAGANGPVKVGFFAGALPANLTAVSGCVTSDAATVDAVKANPAGFYVNIHTIEFPGGAIRGQLSRTLRVEDFSSIVSAVSGANLVAIPSGANEVPTPADPDARAIGLFKAGTDTVDFAIHWANLAPPSAAHFHSGAAGTNGPVVVPFFSAPGGLPASIDGIAGSAPAAADVLANIKRMPQAFYFNMHNAEFPAGALRGQLIRIG